jgi:hypothetical protein
MSNRFRFELLSQKNALRASWLPATQVDGVDQAEARGTVA